MSQQAMPFFESDKAATKYAIQAGGKSMKEVASALWPNKSVERAQTDLLNALNDNRGEQLSTDEHSFIANYCNRHDWVYYVCHRTSHSRPVRQTPHEISAQLQDALFAHADGLKGILAQIDAIKPLLTRVPA